MNLMTWNVRGMNTQSKMDHVFNLLHSHKLSILNLVENKMCNTAIETFMYRFGSNWTHIHNNSCGSKGRILVILDNSVWDFIIISMTSQHITLHMTNTGGFTCYLTFIYASNLVSDRELLWSKMVEDASLINSPWLAFGDFNNALSPKDKKGGLAIPFVQMNSFKNCLLQCALVESYLQGCKYTWRKKVWPLI